MTLTWAEAALLTVSLSRGETQTSEEGQSGQHQPRPLPHPLITRNLEANTKFE